jgi:hypothetical protein
MAYLHQPRQLKITNQPTSVFFGLRVGSLLVLTCMMWGCAKQQASTTPAPQSSPAEQAKAATEQQPPPILAEANEAVTRVFKNAATIDSKHEPSFFIADFNGDASADIAVIVQPVSEKLAEMNQEFPPWILKDPFTEANRSARPPRISPDESLLAIIHGYGPNGWRDAQATQTYLLRNAVGLELRAWPKNEFATAHEGKKVPRLVGDLIGEKLRGSSGYLYFNGAQYSWYDPRTFRGEAEVRITHPGMTPKKKIDLLHPNFVAAEK